ncbi:DUF1287 domain-containing protein [Caulobacter flavus]|uniref:DUF1287 domain-containing protein n=1 Tax=Caulobacter flavus TaxID=1679497 RepID=A0A2N5CQM7_9CAUL|nr:DUF1287 domain-containing protein [Caulobacter flavus]AYV48762.1 DUF1287 domain-containing protein [Caulobacter flavus]PLR10294.1 DUF1287 domain-containing protein [Caulobacter flavus]
MLDLSRRTALSLLAAAPWLGAAARGDGLKLAQAARTQVGVTLDYDPSYRAISYPRGDVLRSTGVCSDVLVRAARDAWNVDLQERVHADMSRAFSAYPAKRAWGQKSADANIDHRRVLNLETYLDRQGARLRASQAARSGDGFADPEPGDVLTWRLFGNGRPHIGVVVQGPERVRVVHNIGAGAREEALWIFKLHKPAGHYRWRA